MVPCRTHTILSTVTIYFVETEEAEQQFFSRKLPSHDVRFVSQLEEVGDDVEVLSVFINSRVSLSARTATARSFGVDR